LSTLNNSIINGKKLLLVWANQPPCILDLEKLEIIWKAKNVKPDSYDLIVPMDDSDGVFLDDDTIATATLRK